MSTNCRIGIQNENGTVDSIYCHHDGYLSYTGGVLLNHYSNELDIRKIISFGDTSALEDTLEATERQAYHWLEDELTIMHSDLDGFLKSWEEYKYLFKDGKWYVDFGEGLVELTNELIEEHTRC